MMNLLIFMYYLKDVYPGNKSGKGKENPPWHTGGRSALFMVSSFQTIYLNSMGNGHMSYKSTGY